MSKKQTISLVLVSGGARGYTHIEFYFVFQIGLYASKILFCYFNKYLYPTFLYCKNHRKRLC